ncbi:MAG: HAD family hydrolase [Candidatus Obscuribacter sp.]|nr:HAD family hydrolase [Candidatus Obscuribacter sp.]
MVIDKTGTLTRGQLTLAKIISLDAAYGDDKVLQLAASLEQSSEHPLAKAIVSAYKLQTETSQRADLPLFANSRFLQRSRVWSMRHHRRTKDKSR